jgi:hypothetical protein
MFCVRARPSEEASVLGHVRVRAWLQPCRKKTRVVPTACRASCLRRLTRRPAILRFALARGTHGVGFKGPKPFGSDPGAETPAIERDGYRLPLFLFDLRRSLNAAAATLRTLLLPECISCPASVATLFEVRPGPRRFSVISVSSCHESITHAIVRLSQLGNPPRDALKIRLGPRLLFFRQGPGNP